MACRLERQVALGGPALGNLLHDPSVVEQRIALLQLPVFACGLALGVDVRIKLHSAAPALLHHGTLSQNIVCIYEAFVVADACIFAK